MFPPFPKLFHWLFTKSNSFFQLRFSYNEMKFDWHLTESHVDLQFPENSPIILKNYSYFSLFFPKNSKMKNNENFLNMKTSKQNSFLHYRIKRVMHFIYFEIICSSHIFKNFNRFKSICKRFQWMNKFKSMK